MSNNNAISAILADQDAQDILTALSGIRSKLPFLVTLPAQERRALAKMGNKSVGFDEKCTAYMQSNPEFLPGFVNKDDVSKDRTLRTQMLRFAADFNALAQQVDDTLLAVSSEIWNADLAYYRNVRAAAGSDRAGAKLIADDLGSRFAAQGRQKGQAATQQASAAAVPAAEPMRQ